MPEDVPEQPAQTAFEKYSAVYEQNHDFVGWLSIPDTNINYPIMQTIDNPNYYLRRNFEKQHSNYGVPYVQENCDLEFSDNCVLYGHHMNDGTMFADLCKYESEDFYKEHKTIDFDTLSGFGKYEIVAVFKTVAYSQDGFKYYHFTQAESEDDFNSYIEKCKELSLYDTGVSAEYGDKLLTLSTCEYSCTNGRMVVVAKRIVPLPAEWAKMPDIKTRDVVKGTIKTLDKSAVAAERMKQAYVRTKDKAEHSISPAETTPDEYAADRISGGTETAVYETAHQFDKQGRKAVKTTKENISKAKEQLQQRKADLPKKQARQKAAENVRRSADTAKQSIKTIDREQRTIKTVERCGKTIRIQQNPRVRLR